MKIIITESENITILTDINNFTTSLKGLSDVDANLNPINNSVLKYNTTSNLWEIGVDVSPVSSVNGKTGIVVLDTDDIGEGTTNLYDKIVSFTGGTNLLITGTYPSFSLTDNTANATDLSNHINDATIHFTESSINLDNITEGTINKFFTATEKTKLSGIADGAEVNVQSDWNQTLNTSDDYIKNKPTDLTDLSLYSTSDLSEGTNLYFTNARVSSNSDVTANTSHRNTITGNPHQVTKTDIGLGNVLNIDTTNASNITSGTLPSTVLPPIAITSVAVYSDETSMLTATTEEGDVAVRSDESKTYMKNSGTTGTMTDWTELQTPTDNVLSVNGYTGTVILTTADISDSLDKRYVLDSDLTNLSNLSGINTGDQDLSGLVPYTGSNANVVLGNYDFSVGTSNLFINSTTGYVGIGTSSPTARLDVVGDANSEGMFTFHTASNTDTYGHAAISVRNAFLTSGARWASEFYDISGVRRVMIGLSNDIDADTLLNIPTGSANKFIWIKGASKSAVLAVLDSSGQFGLGTSYPTEKIDVVGNILATGTIFGSNISGTNTGDQDLSGYMLNTGDTATGSYTFDTDSLFIDSVNHRIGIGNTAPTVKLEVTGNAYVTGDLTVDGIIDGGSF